MISMTLGPCPPPLEIQSGHLQQLQEQFDIDHVQEEAETAIQEKAFELGKKAEKVTGLTKTAGRGHDQGISGIMNHERPHENPMNMAISGGSFLILRQAQRIGNASHIISHNLSHMISNIISQTTSQLYPKRVFFLITFSDAPVCYSSYCCLYPMIFPVFLVISGYNPPSNPNLWLI
jgi:hypothetical protein